MEIHLYDINSFQTVMKKYLSASHPVFLIGHTNITSIYDTGRNDLNYQAIEKHGFNVIAYPSNGGSAITQAGDVGFYFGTPRPNDGWALYIMECLRQWLSTKQLHVQISNNDLLIYGRKVLGYTAVTTGSYTASSIFVAMHNSQELIDEICLKPKTKQSCGFFEFGISEDEVVEQVQMYTKHYIKMVEGRH